LFFFYTVRNAGINPLYTIFTILARNDNKSLHPSTIFGAKQEENIPTTPMRKGAFEMTIAKKTSIGIVLLGIFIAFGSIGNGAWAQQKGRRHQGPPPEAYTACEGKSEGDTAEFVSPHGDTVTGTCEMEGDRLVLRPDNPPDGRSRDDNN
jgi:hypothetical protein